MNIEKQNYKIHIFKYAVNQCINLLLPKNSEDALSVILYQSDEVVWRVATDIYTKSGHQIDFLFIQELLNLRIEPLQNKIAEEARIKAELEAQRLAREAEEARIKAELKAQRIAKETEKQRIKKETEEIERTKLQKYIENYSNIDVCQIFEKTKRIIIKELEVDADQVTLDANIMNDLGADDLDAVELAMALEKEFGVEIPNDTSLCHISTFLDFLLKKLEL